MKRGLIGLAALIAAAGCSDKNVTEDLDVWYFYRNPVIQSETSDPTVFEENGTFYMFSVGSGEEIIPLMTSTDLTNWGLSASVFNEDTEPSFISGTLGNPSVAKVGEKYLLYYSLQKSAANCGIGVAEADLISGPYTDRGAIALASDLGLNGVASPSFYSDGNANWLVFGSFNGIYAVPLSDDGLSLDGSPMQIASDLFDAPFLMEKDGMYYLFASVGKAEGGASCTCTQVVGRADRVTGPYLDRTSKSMLDDGYETLIGNSTKFTGPGHGTVVTIPDGTTWMLYNAYDLSDVSKGRTLMLDRVNWLDGWPEVRGTICSFSADAPALIN